VKSLALLCTFHRGGDAVAMTPGKAWAGLRTWVGTRPMRRRAFLEMLVPAATLASADPDRLAADLAPLLGHDLADHPAVEMSQLRALARYDARARLCELAGIPTIVVTASQDRIAPPASGRALAAAVPGARSIEIRAAAHGLPITEAKTVNALLAEHFAGA
jgi:pimeloyl-ACP methyl ester carboxylesterase